MFSLLYFIESNGAYQEFIDYYMNGKTPAGKTYLIFNEDVHSKDGRVFRAHNKILLAVNFISSKLEIYEIIKEMIKFGLEPDLLVNRFNLDFDGLDPNDAINERAKHFILERAVIAFLKNRNFTFEDGSVLAVSELEKRIEKTMERLGIEEPDFVRKRISEYDKP